MKYEDRLHAYERDKSRLKQMPLSDREYEQEIKKLADKWRV